MTKGIANQEDQKILNIFTSNKNFKTHKPKQISLQGETDKFTTRVRNILSLSHNL